MQRPEPSSIPLSPGVYMYRDAREQVIYVGKARVLRRRVLSYFRPEGLPIKTRAMLSHAVSIEFLTTTTEKEAFLLESSLIKKYRPHYNIILRDDKQYALFRCDIKARYPRLEIVRHARHDGARYFGPYTSALAARETWKLLHRAFPLRRCSDRAMKNRVRPCLYYHMKQCLAPCTGTLDPGLYHEQVEKVCDVLSGRSTELLRELREKMEAAADALEFEKAAVYRDQIQAVEKTVERQATVLPGGGDMDAVGLYSDEHGLSLGVIFVRGGAVTDGRSFFWPGLSFEDASEILWSFLGQFYDMALPPPRILLPWLPRDEEAEEEGDASSVEAHEALEQTLAERRGGSVRIVAPQNQADNRLVDIAQSNAREESRRRSCMAREGVDILALIQKALYLPKRPDRIECVDVSHTGGRQTRVGLVVYVQGMPSKGDYRNYAMPDGGDDYRSLHDWVMRRVTESGPPWPDLLLIDGGRGQIAAVEKGLEDAGKPGLFPLAGIAKARDEAGHADRRAGNVADRIFLPGRSNPLSLRQGGPEILFLQQIRDATHRFAITRHRRARTGAAMSGEIMRLPGIGPSTARLLWDAFSNFEAMQKATIADLQKLPGIGRTRAEALYAHLHGDTDIQRKN